MIEDSNLRLLSFERQEKSEDLSVLKLPASKDSYELLRAIGQWYFIGNKSWHFEEAPDAIYTVTSWIEKNKLNLIRNVLKFDNGKTPLYIKIAIVNEIYRKILNNEFEVNRIDSISVNDLISVNHGKSIFYSDKWKDLKQYIYDSDGDNSSKLLTDYFNISQGTGIKKVFLDYVPFEKALKEVKKDLFDYQIENIDKSSYSTVNNIYKIYSEIKKKVRVVIDTQETIKQDIIENLYNIVGWDKEFDIEVSDLKNLFNDVSDFYLKCEQTNQLFENQNDKIENLKPLCSDIVKNLSYLKKIDLSYDIETLYKYSKVDFDLLTDFINLISKVEVTVNRVTPIIDHEYDSLVKSGKVIDRDPRFEQKKQFYELCKNELEDM
jgi:hypothetical protein